MLPEVFINNEYFFYSLFFVFFRTNLILCFKILVFAEKPRILIAKIKRFCAMSKFSVVAKKKRGSYSKEPNFSAKCPSSRFLQDNPRIPTAKTKCFCEISAFCVFAKKTAGLIWKNRNFLRNVQVLNFSKSIKKKNKQKTGNKIDCQTDRK